MPELPEVQTIVNDLNRKVRLRKITGFWTDWPKTIKYPRASEIGRAICGARIEKVSRRGKNILISLDKDRLLLVHLKMTGHLLVGKWNLRKRTGKIAAESARPGSLSEKVNNYIHIIFRFDNGEELALSDLRKFAKVLFGPREKVEKLAGLDKIGPEPLDPDFRVKDFQKVLSGQKRKIKQVLMDPEKIAGIGNIYSDDILWQARIHPFRLAKSLSKKEIERIFKATKEVLKKALELRGTSISDFRDTAGKPGFYSEKRLVYQREGEPCPRCGRKIERRKMSGRSAHFCPRCQSI